jgi:hypothetical protein
MVVRVLEMRLMRTIGWQRSCGSCRGRHYSARLSLLSTVGVADVTGGRCRCRGRKDRNPRRRLGISQDLPKFPACYGWVPHVATGKADQWRQSAVGCKTFLVSAPVAKKVTATAQLFPDVFFLFASSSHQNEGSVVRVGAPWVVVGG